METSAQQREEREKGQLVKRDSIPQSPHRKSHSCPASNGDELDWQEAADNAGAGTELWVHHFGNWVLGHSTMLRKEGEEDQGPL